MYPVFISCISCFLQNVSKIFQLEEQAMLELLHHYKADSRVDEYITVERVSREMAAPLWKRERHTSQSYWMIAIATELYSLHVHVCPQFLERFLVILLFVSVVSNKECPWYDRTGQFYYKCWVSRPFQDSAEKDHLNVFTTPAFKMMKGPTAVSPNSRSGKYTDTDAYKENNIEWNILLLSYQLFSSDNQPP